MTILAEPTMIITREATPSRIEDPGRQAPGQRSMTRHGAIHPRRAQALDGSMSTEELLGQLARLPGEHPARAQLRARAVERNLPLAAQLARRYAGRGELLDDLTQVAAVALIQAVDRYDPSRGVPFAGFAIPSILGALKRHFRDTAWAIRVPRSIQELALRVPAAANELAHQRSRTPTPAEIADHLHVTVGGVQAAVVAWQSYSLPFLSTPNANTGVDIIDGLGAIDPRYASVDEHLSLRPLIAALPLRERRILIMRFYDHMNQSQIAAEIGVSQMHVSRLLKQTLANLRAQLSG